MRKNEGPASIKVEPDLFYDALKGSLALAFIFFGNTTFPGHLTKWIQKLGAYFLLLVTSTGFFFRSEASAPWMVKGEGPLQLKPWMACPERKKKKPVEANQ